MKTMKKLWPYVMRHKGYFALVILFGALMSLTDASVTYIVKLLFDEVFQNKNIEMALLIPAMIPLVYLAHGVGRFFHFYFMKMTGEFIATRIQQELQDKYMHLSLSYYGRSDTGAMISRVISDVQVVQWGITIFSDIIREPLTIILLLAWILYLDWKLTMILLLVGPVIIIIINSLAKSVRKYSHHQQESMEQFVSTLKETVDGVRIIQSFNLMGVMQERLQKVIQHYLGVRRKIIIRQESSGPITEFLAASVLAVIFYFKGQDIIQGKATLGDFMSYFVALGYIQQPIKKLQDGVMRLQPTLASADRIFSVLESGMTVPQITSPKKFPTNWRTIEFKNVSFSYGAENVLKNVSLNVRRGEVIALVGESGSGKSTLVNLLERFYDPTQGEILIDGINTREIDLFDLRENIALVTQDVFLFNDSIETNIKAGNHRAESISVESSAKMANAHDFISKIPEQYKAIAGDRGGRLSGGEKQRVSIARAIYKDAPILIMDEATSALDSASEVEVQKGLDKLMEGKTAFVIAHRLSTVVKADRILVFKSGQIVEEGTHSELIDKRGAYFSFSQLQKT